MSQSNQQFDRTLEERHAIVKSLVRAYVRKSPNHARDENHRSSVEILAACRHLDSILAPPDKPRWLTVGIPVLEAFSKHNQVDQATAVAVWLHDNGKAIEKPIVPKLDGEVNFDQIYEEIRDAVGLPALFDQMIDAVGRIIALNVIDSSFVKSALNRLQATLHSNRKGSQGAIFATMDYGKLILQVLRGYGKKALGPAFEAFDKAYCEAKDAVEQADQDYRKATLEALVDPDDLRRYIASGVVDTSALQQTLPPALLEGPRANPSSDPTEATTDG